ncbi:hypothetical protein [Streptomyces sp. NPDC088707]
MGVLVLARQLPPAAWAHPATWAVLGTAFGSGTTAVFASRVRRTPRHP